MPALRRRVHETLDQTAKGDRIGRLVSAGPIALIAANVAAVVIESEPWLDATYRSWLHALELVSTVIFTAEYALRLVVGGRERPRPLPAADGKGDSS
jgi:voltage-gated potassium channel